MSRKLFFASAALMFTALFSGCGGSSSSISSDTPSSSTSFVGASVKLGFDEDNDNKPDVLDFDGVEQLYINSSGSTVSGAVPFMVWVSELATQSSPDIITTNLTAGTDYSVEFSKNFAEPLGARIPDIEILDPSGVLVSTDLTLSTYPAE